MPICISLLSRRKLAQMASQKKHHIFSNLMHDTVSASLAPQPEA
jgi:hypothetical protein